MRKPTEKQKKFCREYLKDFNATKAYVRAGYSKNGARQSAYRMLTNAYIQAYLTGLIQKQAEEDKITVSEIIQDLKLLKDRCMQEIEVRDKEGEPTGEWRFDSAGANRSLELLGKYLGMFVERSELTINIKEVKTIIITIQSIILKHVSDPEVRNRIAKELQDIGL